MHHLFIYIFIKFFHFLMSAATGAAAPLEALTDQFREEKAYLHLKFNLAK